MVENCSNNIRGKNVLLSRLKFKLLIYLFSVLGNTVS